MDVSSIEIIRMKPQSNRIRSLARVLWFFSAASAGVAAMAADTPAHLRGTIVSAAPASLTVKTAKGDVIVAFDATTRISGVVPSSLDQIKPGTFVGIANVPATGASSALEVVVFPDAMKGSGLGDYPWDLSPAAAQGGAQTSAMTNGTVKSSTTASAIGTTSAMTNGTVKSTSNASGLVLTVDYGKGEKTIQVPSGVPVVGVVQADSSKLLPGAHVFIATKKDSPQSAAFIAVGINGTVPPM